MRRDEIDKTSNISFKKRLKFTSAEIISFNMSVWMNNVLLCECFRCHRDQEEFLYQTIFGDSRHGTVFSHQPVMS